MADKRRKKWRKRKSADRGVSPKLVDWWNRRNTLLAGGAMGLAFGLVVAFNAYQAQGPLLAIGSGVVVVAVTWISLWINYGRKRQE